MPQAIIDNPILNSAFAEPTRHFKFGDEGITNDIIDTRRTSSYFIPIAQPKKKGKQLQFETEWTSDRLEENRLVNLIRERVGQWRRGGHVGVTPTTARLLSYWTDPTREKKLFFCQIEAVETAIYTAEVARKYGDAWIENDLRAANDTSNPGLPRIALKMATGSGKTVVMAMLIAWHTLNKLEDRQDARFSDAFLIVTPGITIRDRLRVLLPTDPENYYRQRDVLPADLLERLGQARIVITNYHAFLPREQGDAARLTKAILSKGQPGVFSETPQQIVRRVCRDLGSKKNVIVINDEAHHCYRRRPDAEKEALTGEERREAEKRDKEARVWLSGLEAVKSKIGIRTIYDLSATPFFLQGSGYPEGTLFPWVVSDFSLVDAIESGIVKVPRVPVADNSMVGDQPTYRSLWLRIKDDLPKKGRKTDAVSGEPKLPAELQGALHSLYGNYEQAYRRWEQNAEARLRGLTPPVFVVVCSNTNVSKLVFDYVAGWSKPLPDGSDVVVPGALGLFNNEQNGAWSARPNTILVDSEQLESGEGMTPEFKKIASAEIEEFKAEYRQRFPGRSADDLSDEDLLREVMNTVGKAGKLGEHVRCVVSVSMLTEGWDANTVTHILGVRAFGTQLLCEQVVGRGLRRMSYAANENGRFTPEYAEVYGVPFSFIPTSGSTSTPVIGVLPTRVRALEERIACEITFPRLAGYRYEIPSQRLSARFTDESRYALSTADIPTKTENRPIVGEGSIHTLDDLRKRRDAEVAFLLAKLVLEKYFRQDGEPRTDRPTVHRFDAQVQGWLFPQILAITKRWLAECVTCKDNTFPQLLLLIEFAHDAADRIYKAIVASAEGSPALRPQLRPYDVIGSTRYVDFDTTKAVYPTDPNKSHISHVVADTGSWEQKLAQALEEMPEIDCYVKNQGLDFTIPYTLNGEEKQYLPDFIARSGDLSLIIEVSGEARKDKAAKVSTARTLWAPAVNNHGGFGRWAFVEVTDPWDAQRTIRAAVAGAVSVSGTAV
ncbi:MAG: restriction endonuclease subunit R [Acidobacteria bacterium]|nr:MAG: restriction endonuclease subunit R [Acidobacteriota bacterium]